jgi:hypothetical protein
MKINKENFEAYFLDYFEGNLTPSEITELHKFIELNPDVRNQFEEFEEVSIIPDLSIQFEKKESLKKDSQTSILINHENIIDFLIAEMEGLLLDNEILSLNSFISENPQYESEKKILQLTQLNPDQNIVFSSKESLKHKAIPVDEINESNYEEFMVKQVEGIISNEESKNLEEFLLQNPHLQHDKQLLSLTKINSDLSITYPDKASLKKSIVPIRRLVYYGMAMAASFALLFGFFNYWDQNQSEVRLANHSTGQISSGASHNISVQDNRGNTQHISPAPIAQTQIAKTHHSISEENSVSQSVQNISTSKPARTEQGDLLNLVAMNDIRVVSHDHVAPEFMFIRTSQMHSNEYIELYYNIKLAEQIQYAQMNEKDKNPEKTLFNNLTSKVGDLFAQNKNREVEQSNVSVWTFAELGVKTYNSITKDNVSLDLERDETGKVIGYNLSGDKLDLQKEVGK